MSHTIISLEKTNGTYTDYIVQYTDTIDADYGADADGQRGEMLTERTITRIEHTNGCLVDPETAPWIWEECEAILAQRGRR